MIQFIAIIAEVNKSTTINVIAGNLFILFDCYDRTFYHISKFNLDTKIQ
ncbi:hypothetical protein BH20BAC1_BH20BAC1_26050 [soil metagenome]